MIERKNIIVSIIFLFFFFVGLGLLVFLSSCYEPCYGSDSCESCIDEDKDGVCTEEDCDDDNIDINPAAEEICGNRIDEDCDGIVAMCPSTDYDNDGDPNETDCAPRNFRIHHGAIEICGNGIDDNCNLEIDDLNVCDKDGDGYSIPEDCDDTSFFINPDATEICGNGIDENCDVVDIRCPIVHKGPAYVYAGRREIIIVFECIDNDGDNYGENCHLGPDCDDNNADRNLGIEEICGDEVDNNCDGYINERCIVCIDNDGDNYGENCHLGQDCDDNDLDINPEVEEICGDEVDNNCDGNIDENCSDHIDNDGDCHCKVAPCMDSVNPTCEVWWGGDCDDDPTDSSRWVVCEDEEDNLSKFILTTAQQCPLGSTFLFLTDGSILNNPWMHDTTNDLFDNDCDGLVDETGQQDPCSWTQQEGGGWKISCGWL